jgi:hypothetical protein
MLASLLLGGCWSGVAQAYGGVEMLGLELH